MNMKEESKKYLHLLLLIILVSCQDNQENFNFGSEIVSLKSQQVVNSIGNSEIIIKKNEALINHTFENGEEKSFYFRNEFGTQNFQKINLLQSQLLYTSHSLLVIDRSRSSIFSFEIPIPENASTRIIEEFELNSGELESYEFEAFEFGQFSNKWSVNAQELQKTSLGIREQHDLQNNRVSGRDCAAGGCGSSSCEIGGEMLNLFGETCSVSCQSGFYACCPSDAEDCNCYSNVECSFGLGLVPIGGGSHPNACYTVIRAFHLETGDWLIIVYEICI